MVPKYVYQSPPRRTIPPILGYNLPPKSIIPPIPGYNPPPRHTVPHPRIQSRPSRGTIPHPGVQSPTPEYNPPPQRTQEYNPPLWGTIPKAGVQYSKNPHKRTSGLRTLRLKFAQKDTICIRTHPAWKIKTVPNNLYNKSTASQIRIVTPLLARGN